VLSQNASQQALANPEARIAQLQPGIMMLQLFAGAITGKDASNIKYHPRRSYESGFAKKAHVQLGF